MSDSIELTEEQKELILNEWNGRPNSPPGIKELTSLAFPAIEEKYKDGRSKYGRAVKTFLATRKIKAHGAHEYQGKIIELTEDHKQFIDNNASMMNAQEMARVLFADNTLSNLSSEARVVNEYIKTLNNTPVFSDPQEVPTGIYQPPKAFEECLEKIHKYVPMGIKNEKLTPKQKKDVTNLIGYLSTHRFSHQVNNLQTEQDRELFESSFVRYTYDKGDLSQEEVDQYVILSTEVIIASNIQARIEHLQNLLENSANDTEGRRISMSLVQAIGTAQTEYNQCVGRQQKLLGDLKEKRSDKLKKEIKENASILNLVQMWKEEESRKSMIQLAEIRKKAVKEEVERLSTLDEVKARILGISEDEVLNG